MDFFGLGNAAEFNNPIGQLIKNATDPLLLGPDWSKNLDICDRVTHTKDGPVYAIRAISKRLQDSEKNTLYLALLLMETCMKNCGSYFASSVDKNVMDEIIAIAKGSKGNKNSTEALRLVQQWGRAYENDGKLRIFFDAYMMLRRSPGMVFPVEDVTDSAIYNASGPPAVQSSTKYVRLPHSCNCNEFLHAAILHSIVYVFQLVNCMSIYSGVTPASSATAVDVDMDADNNKLLSDLGTVMEKVRMCREMLLVSPGITQDELLSEIIGFLEACRDRMMDLIEAGSQGMLREDIFEECLKVNDAVTRTLEAEKVSINMWIVSLVSDGSFNRLASALKWTTMAEMLERRKKTVTASSTWKLQQHSQKPQMR